MITVLSVVVRRDTYYQILGAFNCIIVYGSYIYVNILFLLLFYVFFFFVVFFFSVDSVVSLLLQTKSLLCVGNAVIKSLLLSYYYIKIFTFLSECGGLNFKQHQLI